MVPALQFPDWEWLALVLAAPAVVWGAWPFHRAAATNLRHGARDDGHPDLARHPRRAGLVGRRAARAARAMTYLEVGGGRHRVRAARPLRSRRAPSGGRAPRSRALLDLGAKDVAVLRDGGEVRVPVGELQVGDRFVVRPGEKIATDGVVDDGTLRASTPRCSPASRCRSRCGPGDAVVGGVRQRRRPAGGARHPGRRRHPARPDGPPRRGRAERQGRGPAAGRPGVGRVRAGRDRARGRDAGLLARRRAPARTPRSPPRSPC